MSLDYNLTKIKNYKELWEPCTKAEAENGGGFFPRPWTHDEKTDTYKRLNVVTHCLIIGTMALDVGTITEKNYKDVWARCEYLRQTGNAIMIKNKKGAAPTLAEVKRNIGLYTNVITRSWKQWLKRHAEYDFTRILKQAESEEEPTEAVA